MIEDGRYRFNSENIDRSPEEPGVYALYDDSELIYYGRAQGNTVTIRSRLQSHLRGDEGSCTQNATHYKREPCPNPVTREKELLEEFKKTHHGNLPRCNERVG